MKKYKLGVTYSLFLGEELLRASIKSIREQVDYINVVYQKISWTGEKCSENLQEILSQLQEEGLVDNILKFDFNYAGKETGKKVSRFIYKKKNLGIKDLIKKKCTHCMIMDVDEFYFTDEFKKAKEFIFKHHITHSVCSIYDYRISPIYRMKDAQVYGVPFILKLYPWSRIIGKGNLPCRVDEQRVFLFIPIVCKFYYLNMVNMHHMTGIRKDYQLKIKCSPNNFSEQGRESLKYYSKMHSEMEQMSEKEILSNGYIEVNDEFGILKEWDQ